MLELADPSTKGDTMSGLRSEWTPQQVQDNLGEASENLPEARTTDRFPVAGTASGMDLQAGEELYEEDAAAAGPGSELRLPPDPPRRPTDQGGE
jgi:hypothetical protein